MRQFAESEAPQTKEKSKTKTREDTKRIREREVF